MGVNGAEIVPNGLQTYSWARIRTPVAMAGYQIYVVLLDRIERAVGAEEAKRVVGGALDNKTSNNRGNQR
jgi:hypothetical protein